MNATKKMRPKPERDLSPTRTVRWTAVAGCASAFLLLFLFLTPARPARAGFWDFMTQSTSETLSMGASEDLKMVELNIPQPEIPIPTLALTPGLVDPASGEVIAPWIGEYAAGVYTFLLSIVGLVAGVFILVGGFQYMTAGGSADRTAAAKRRIVDAIVGLILAFGSYALLYTINPDLVTFEALRLEAVKTDPWSAVESTQLATTTANTGLAEERDPPQPGEYVFQYYPTCPFDFTSPGPKDSYTAKKTEFITKAMPYITATDARERMQQVGQMAATCRPNLGSCGNTIGTIWAMALKGSPNYETMSKKASSKNADCLDAALKPNTSQQFNCGDFRLSVRFELPSKLNKLKFARRCYLDRFKSRFLSNKAAKEKQAKGLPLTAKDKNQLDPNWRDGDGCNLTNCVSKPGDSVQWVAPAPGCFKTSWEARTAFLKEVQEEAKSNSKLAGYPDSWAETLRPGDYINIYNGNTDLTGGHAIMFLGWAKDGITAYTIEGGGGKRPGYDGVWKVGLAGFNKECLKAACGARVMPMTKIFNFQ